MDSQSPSQNHAKADYAKLYVVESVKQNAKEPRHRSDHAVASAAKNTADYFSALV